MYHFLSISCNNQYVLLQTKKIPKLFQFQLFLTMNVLIHTKMKYNFFNQWTTKNSNYDHIWKTSWMSSSPLNLNKNTIYQQFNLILTNSKFTVIYRKSIFSKFQVVRLVKLISFVLVYFFRLLQITFTFLHCFCLLLHHKVRTCITFI